MLGFFIFEQQPSVTKPLVKAHSALNKDLKGYFYVRMMDSKDVSSVKSGDKFFGVLDDASGYGACMFVLGLDVEENALLIQHNLHVKGDTQIDGNETVNGNVTVMGSETVTGDVSTGAQFHGMNTATTLGITSAHCAVILAAAISGQPAPPSPVLPPVQVIMA